jgi:hypothetical protein
MNLAATLIVTVLAAGGSHDTKPSVLKNATITVRVEIGCRSVQPPGSICSPPGPTRVASSHDGKLTAKLAPGHYIVDAVRSESNFESSAGCQQKRVTLTSGHTTRLTLRCSTTASVRG